MIGARRAAREPRGANGRSGPTNAAGGCAAAPTTDRRAGGPAVRAPRAGRQSGTAPYFFASSFSISSMMAFISLIAALNGAEVVMSTPASLSRSMGYFDPPAESIFR
jgi:hypothetical protein